MGDSSKDSTEGSSQGGILVPGGSAKGNQAGSMSAGGR
jgi:hypothetical protein